MYWIYLVALGAQRVTSVDLDGKNIAQQKEMKQQKQLENWEILKGNVLKFEAVEPFDIIFADPPYDIPNIQQFPKMFSNWLDDSGLLILEHRPQIQFHEKHEWQKEYGSTTITIFAKQ